MPENKDDFEADTANIQGPGSDPVAPFVPPEELPAVFPLGVYEKNKDVIDRYIAMEKKNRPHGNPLFLHRSAEEIKILFRYFLVLTEAGLETGNQDPISEFIETLGRCVALCGQHNLYPEKAISLSEHVQYLTDHLLPEHFPYLLKIGQDADAEFAPIVSKLLHVLQYGSEISDEDPDLHEKRRKDAVAEYAALLGGDEASLRIAYKYFQQTPRKRTFFEKINNIFECLHSGNRGPQANIEDFGGLFLQPFLYQYFAEDGEEIYADTLDELDHFIRLFVYAGCYVNMPTVPFKKIRESVEPMFEDAKKRVYALISGKLGSKFDEQVKAPKVRESREGRSNEFNDHFIQRFLESLRIHRELIRITATEPKNQLELANQCYPLLNLSTGLNLSKGLSIMSTLLRTDADLLKFRHVRDAVEKCLGWILILLSTGKKKSQARQAIDAHFAMTGRTQKDLKELEAMYSNLFLQLGDYADSPKEAAGYAYSYSLASNRKLNEHGFQYAQQAEKMFDQLTLVPTSITTLIALYSPLPAELNRPEFSRFPSNIFFRVDSSFIHKFFSQKRMEQHPELAQCLLDTLLKPNYRTHYNACMVAAEIVKGEGGRGYFCGMLKRAILEQFTQGPDRSAIPTTVMGHIFQRLPKEVVTTFAQAESSKEKGPNEWIIGLASMDDLVFEERETEKLIRTIIENRTSHISHDGHKVPFDKHESPLVEKLGMIEARIKKNKETGRKPDGLACNVTFNTRNCGPIHGRIQQDGSFVLRILDTSGHDVAEIDQQWFEDAFRKKVDAFFTDTKISVIHVPINRFAAFFHELHYLALEKLKVVYVRKKVDVGDQVVPPPSPIPPPPDSGETVLAPGFPQTVERTDDGTMAIDLTDREKKVLSGYERADRVRIESNRAKVLEVFSRLGRGENLEELPPENAGTMLLHECVKIGSDHYFSTHQDPLKVYHALREGKLKPEDVYIRVGRAFTQPLPYMRKLRHVGDDSSAPGYFTVRQKRIRREQSDFRRDLFVSGEGGETLETGTQEKILYFDVDDPGKGSLHHRLFERIQSGKDIPGIMRSVETQIKEALDEYRRVARKKYLEGMGKPDPMKYSRIMSRLEKRAHRAYEHAEMIAHEVSAKATTILQEPLNREEQATPVTLRLPSVFNFDETFNQGRFQSLRTLLDSTRKPRK